MPPHIRIRLARGDRGFGSSQVQETCENLGLQFIFVVRLNNLVQQM